MKKWEKTFETSSWSETFTQDEDTNSDRVSRGEAISEQDLTLTAVDASSNEHYLVIETSRWALNPDEIDDFCQLLKDFIAKRAGDPKNIKA